jgi:hypothetical protein
MNDDTDQVTFPLSKPISHNGTTYNSLTFREATAGDLATGESVSGDLTKTLAILACMADVPLQVVRQIRARDLKALNDLVAPLMGEDAPKGKTPAPTGPIS